MTHKKRLTDASTCKSNIEGLLRKSSFSNLVEIFKIKGDSFFDTMIKIVAISVAIQKVMPNMRIETNAQSIRKQSRNTSFAPVRIFAIQDLNGVHNGIVNRFFLTELFRSIKKPAELFFFSVIRDLFK